LCRKVHKGKFEEKEVSYKNPQKLLTKFWTILDRIEKEATQPGRNYCKKGELERGPPSGKKKVIEGKGISGEPSRAAPCEDP